MVRKTKKIVFAGGGTAGHVYPLIEVYEELKDESHLSFTFFGTGSEFERDIAKKHRLSYQKVSSGKIRRNVGLASWFNNLRDLFLLIIGSVQAFFLFWGDRPSLIFSKGGYGSLPTVLAGAFWRVPIIIHESDVIPGLANKIALRYARRIATAFPPNVYPLQVKKKGFFAGLPLRKEFYKNSVDKGGKYILIFGGSQGASSLNDLVFKNLEKILKIAPIIHLTGRPDYVKAIETKKSLPKNFSDKYGVYEFRDDMAELIRNSSMVICRAGANSIFEVAAFGKKLLLIPIPVSVTRHQLVNALYLRSEKMAEVFLHGQGDGGFVNKIKKTLEMEGDRIEKLNTPWSSRVISEAILSEIKCDDFWRGVKKVFLIGIGGVSMRGIASVLKKMGKTVFGSDIKSGGHDKRNVKKNMDLVVYSSAASFNSPARVEHERAHEYKIPVEKRSEMIGTLLKNKSGISISGMHGKTTTSALVSRAMTVAGFDPSYLIGAQPSQLVPIANYTKNEYFVVEACEYDGSFLDFPTTVALITNIEEEHLDYFKGGLNEIIKTFSKFISNIREGGLLVFNADDLNTRKAVEASKRDLRSRKILVRSFGFSKDADFRIGSYCVKDEKISFSISSNGGKVELNPRIAGKHFAYDCAGAFAICDFLGIDETTSKIAFDGFVGAKGRFELMGNKNGVPIYYDYAHHPTELKSVFASLDDLFPDRRKFFIFEPHQQDRFNRFFKDFYEVLFKSDMDIIGILPVYKVTGRDANPEFTSRDLVDKLSRTGKKAFLFDSYDDATLFLRKNCKSRDVVVVTGATNIWKVAEELIKK